MKNKTVLLSALGAAAAWFFLRKEEEPGDSQGTGNTDEGYGDGAAQSEPEETGSGVSTGPDVSRLPGGIVNAQDLLRPSLQSSGQSSAPPIESSAGQSNLVPPVLTVATVTQSSTNPGIVTAETGAAAEDIPTPIRDNLFSLGAQNAWISRVASPRQAAVALLDMDRRIWHAMGMTSSAPQNRLITSDEAAAEVVARVFADLEVWQGVTATNKVRREAREKSSFEPIRAALAVVMSAHRYNEATGATASPPPPPPVTTASSNPFGRSTGTAPAGGVGFSTSHVRLGGHWCAR